MRKSLEHIARFVSPSNYPNLPEELRGFNYHILDCGHIIMVVPECLLEAADDDNDLDMLECPCPVKYVLETGYRIYREHVICDAPYDKDIGLDVPDEYTEY